MTYLVTGATGNVGRRIVRDLLRAGHRVRALSRDPGRVELSPEVELVRGDLNAPDTWRYALDGGEGVHLRAAAGDDYADDIRTKGEVREPFAATRNAAVDEAAAYTVAPTVEKILGRPPRSFADWVCEHADAFA